MQVDEIDQKDDLDSKFLIKFVLISLFFYCFLMIFAGGMAVNGISPNNLIAHLILDEDLDSCKPILNGFLLKC